MVYLDDCVCVLSDLTWLPLLGVGRKSWYIIIIIYVFDGIPKGNRTIFLKFMYFFFYKKPPIPLKVLFIGANTYALSFTPLFKTFSIFVFCNAWRCLRRFFHRIYVLKTVSFHVTFHLKGTKWSRREKGRVNMGVGRKGMPFLVKIGAPRELCEQRRCCGRRTSQLTAKHQAFSAANCCTIFSKLPID